MPKNGNNRDLDGCGTEANVTQIVSYYQMSHLINKWLNKPSLVMIVISTIGQLQLYRPIKNNEEWSQITEDRIINQSG